MSKVCYLPLAVLENCRDGIPLYFIKRKRAGMS